MVIYDVTESLRKLEQAIQKNQILKIVYTDAKGEQTKRKIKPKQLVFSSTWMLTANCYLRNEERNFRLDRIVSIKKSKLKKAKIKTVKIISDFDIKVTLNTGKTTKINLYDYFYHDIKY